MTYNVFSGTLNPTHSLADAWRMFWHMLTTLYCWLHHGEHFNCCLINCIVCIARHLDMICNSSKTVCMVVNPKRRCNMVAYQFTNFMVNNVILKYVNEFKYLGHVAILRLEHLPSFSLPM